MLWQENREQRERERERVSVEEEGGRLKCDEEEVRQRKGGKYTEDILEVYNTHTDTQ